MKIEKKRFLHPSIIDRCGWVDFKHRKQKRELIRFLYRRNLDAVHIFYNYQRVTFTILKANHTWIEVAVEDVIEYYIFYTN